MWGLERENLKPEIPYDGMTQYGLDSSRQAGAWVRTNLESIKELNGIITYYFYYNDNNNNQNHE